LVKVNFQQNAQEKYTQTNIQVTILRPFSIFIRSYCYTVWSAIGVILSSVCPTVCPPVTLCTVALRFGVQG